jgi:TetR/AcrR family transcriptional regulator, repressor of fatR-cypB operon
MAPKAKSSKRDAILNAMLDIVVERGFHDAPMALLAQRSGASIGVIYHYFESKDAIIQTLHERIRTLKLNAFFESSPATEDSRESFIQGCLGVYTFYRIHKREMRFYEQYEHAGFICSSDSMLEDARTAADARRLSSKSSGGVLNEWPTAIQEEVTLGALSRLASHPRKLPDTILREIVEGMWEMVKAKQ